MKTFNIEDTAMILIDHQVGTNTWASTTPLALLQRNVIILAKFAKGTGMPVVLTSSQETNVNVQGPLMPELQEICPDEFAARTLVPAPTIWSINRLFPGPRGIFLEKRITASPNFAVRSSKSNTLSVFPAGSSHIRKSPEMSSSQNASKSARALRHSILLIPSSLLIRH